MEFKGVFLPAGQMIKQRVCRMLLMEVSHMPKSDGGGKCQGTVGTCSHPIVTSGSLGDGVELLMAPTAGRAPFCSSISADG